MGMKYLQFKNISALILLMVFVSMIVFTDFHRHSVVDVRHICENCQHNIPHPHHINTSVSFENICLACQWVNNVFDNCSLSDITICLSAIETITNHIQLKHCPTLLQKLTNKAPPRHISKVV